MAPATATNTIVTRTEVEDFLFHEADMLDSWRLEEWLELFTLDCTYEVPALDRPDADPGLTWSLIHDHRTMLEQRVIRLKKPEAHAEFPHSKTSRIVGNVRILAQTGEDLLVAANFILNRTKGGKFDTYVGRYEYTLVPVEGSFKIRQKKTILNHDKLDPQGKISFII